jgi:nucleoid DNA-binding protein
MDKYLQQILREVNTIIIPGLGALTVTNEKTGETMFMSYLKYDDGKLTQHIAEKEGMSENDAKNLVAKYVREITLKLDQGESYDMFQFGRFIKNKDGDVDFENWQSYADANTPANSGNSDTQAAAIAASEAAATIVPPTPVTPPAPPVAVKAATPTPVEAPKPTTEAPKTPVENTYIPAADLAKKPETKAETVAPAAKPVVPAKAVVPPKPVKPAKVVAPKAPKPPKAPREPRVRKKRGVGFWIFIALVALLAIAIPVVVVYYDQVSANFQSHPTQTPTKKPAPAQETPPAETPVAEETVPEVAPEPTPEVAPAPAIPVERTPVSTGGAAVTDGSKPYHIIGGAFGLQTNADKFAEKLNSAGGHAVVLGQYDNLFLVSVDAFASKNEADQALKAGGTKGWVFKKK